MAVAAFPSLADEVAIVEATHWSPTLGRAMPYLTAAGGAPGPGAPVVYLLHGHGGGEWDWFSAGGARLTAQVLVEAGALPACHLVAPGVGNSWYVDGPEPHGSVATVLLDEFMPMVERTLRADPARRALIGLSMGGFGALHLGLERPADWRFIGAISPAIFTPGSVFSDLQLAFFSGVFGDPLAPDRYAAADPFTRVPELAEASARPAFYLSCGRDDALGLAAGTRAFGAALAAIGVPATVRILPGHHDWAFWRAQLPEALVAFGAAIG
jgi:S-formylglutathione hydrolase FrmB